MADITDSITINAPREKVWESWDRFGEIARFNKGLRASALLPGSAATGTGARRRCELKDGKRYLHEEIGAYRKLEQIEIVVFETNLPVKSLKLMLTFNAPSAETTRIDASVNFTLKFGPLGRILKLFALKEFRADIARLLSANKAFNETV